MFTLVFSRRYAMAHRLRHDTSEKCVIPHGHNEIVTVRLAATHSAPLDGAANVITPFDDAKSRWHEWIDAHVDHALQLALDDPLLGYFVTAEPERVARIMTLPGDPTTEILAACFMAKLNAFLDADGAELMCEEVSIEETPTNRVVFAGDPAKVLPQVTDREHWWQRADMSINDFSAAAETAGEKAGDGAAPETVEEDEPTPLVAVAANEPLRRIGTG